MRLVEAIGATFAVVLVAGCAVVTSSSSNSCAARVVSVPSTATVGEVVGGSAQNLIAECDDTGAVGFVDEPMTGLTPRVFFDGVEHVFDYVEPLEAKPDGSLTMQLALPPDLAVGSEVEIEVAGVRSTPITIVE